MIATFNINNVVCRLPNLLEWLRAAERDVVCLQEFKAADASFPTAALEDAGYGAVWRGQRSWKGVAILAREDGSRSWSGTSCLAILTIRRAGGRQQFARWVVLHVHANPLPI
jgi:exonuclease III